MGGAALASLGPGSVLGERASLEQGRRTATVRALTSCRVVSYLAADLSPEDLRELAAGHHREDHSRPRKNRRERAGRWVTRSRRAAVQLGQQGDGGMGRGMRVVPPPDHPHGDGRGVA